MNRVIWFILCTAVGIELIAWSLLVPAHIRAVDARVLELSGAKGATIADEGLAFLDDEKIGPARLILSVVQTVGGTGKEQLATRLEQIERAQPKTVVWGGSSPYLEHIFEKNPPTNRLATNQGIIDFLLTTAARRSILDGLTQSRKPGVLEIIETRNRTNTTFFPPALSASGQPLDATIVMTGLLILQDHFTASVRDGILSLASTANQGGDIQGLEGVYLDLLSLGKRLNWGQLIELVRTVPDVGTLQRMAELFRQHEGDWPVLYGAIHIMESPKPVVNYVTKYSETGMKDLVFALRCGVDAAKEVLSRQLMVHRPIWRDKIVTIGPIRVAYVPLANIATEQPVLALITKYVLCFFGALLVARAVTYFSPGLVDEIMERRPIVSGPQMAIALCLLFLVVFFSETLLARAPQATELPLQIKFPVASAALRATIPHQIRTMIDKFSALSLLIFFILQATIYVFCRMKLAEIRRQTLPSKLKLRLLENEEQLFDAGLYFGFVGTVVSLILVSVGIVRPSLMAAYSSTSFGIIFVSILKIFHVRPYKRRLILDSEITERESQPA